MNWQLPHPESKTCGIVAFGMKSIVACLAALMRKMIN